jgi:hypothetical protein
MHDRSPAAPADRDGVSRPLSGSAWNARADALARGLRAVAPPYALAYLVFHGYEHAPVREGRDAVLARLAGTARFELEWVLVLLPLAAYGLAYLRGLRQRRDPASGLIGRLSAALGAGLLGLHLRQVWWPRHAARAPTAAYFGMLEASARPAGLALVLALITASVLHFTLASLPLFEALALGPGRGRALAALAGTALWVWFVDLLAAYGAGAPLL